MRVNCRRRSWNPPPPPPPSDLTLKHCSKAPSELRVNNAPHAQDASRVISLSRRRKRRDVLQDRRTRGHVIIPVGRRMLTFSPGTLYDAIHDTMSLSSVRSCLRAFKPARMHFDAVDSSSSSEPDLDRPDISIFRRVSWYCTTVLAIYRYVKRKIRYF